MPDFVEKLNGISLLSVKVTVKSPRPNVIYGIAWQGDTNRCSMKNNEQLDITI